MSKKRRENKRPEWAAVGGKGDSFARLYKSMLLSPAFQDLTPKQQITLLYCNVSLWSGPFDESSGQFYMNKGLWCDTYNLFSSNSNAKFCACMAELIEHGFIDCIGNGYSTKEKSLYRFSTRWKAWGTEAFTLPDNVKTLYMIREEKRQSGKP